MVAPGETALCMALRFIFDGDKTTLFGCIFFAAGDEERNLGLAPLKPLCPWWTMYWLLEFDDWFCWSGLLNGTDTLGFRGGTPGNKGNTNFRLLLKNVNLNLNLNLSFISITYNFNFNINLMIYYILNYLDAGWFFIEDVDNWMRNGKVCKKLQLTQT